MHRLAEQQFFVLCILHVPRCDGHLFSRAHFTQLAQFDPLGKARPVLIPL